MEEVKNAKELLQETISLLRYKKISAKALAEADKRVTSKFSNSKANWKLACKMYASKGKGRVADNPLEIDPMALHKDMIVPTLLKLCKFITATEAFNSTDLILGEYLEVLENMGIKIEIDSNCFEHYDTDALDGDIEEAFNTSKAYINTLEEFSDEIKNEHAQKAEELNFAPATAYSRVVNIYNKGINGKEIDDDVQNILAYNALLDQAVNLTADYAREIDPEN